MNTTKILIVEDESVTAIELETQLKDFEYGIAGTAFKCEGTLRLFSTCHPDIILIDFMLRREKTGINLIQEIRSLSMVPVIFLTGNLSRDKKLFTFELKSFSAHKIGQDKCRQDLAVDFCM